MTETRLCTYFPGGHAAYPQFSPADSPEAARMNGFYLALRDAALQGAAYRENGSVCTADYTCTMEGDSIRIVYTLRLRQHGKSTASRTYTHIWQGGLLVRPRKKRSRLLSFKK